MILFGSLPNKEELAQFQQMLAQYRTLPTSFVRDIIMKAPSPDMMNTLARSVLTLYSYCLLYTSKTPALARLLDLWVWLRP